MTQPARLVLRLALLLPLLLAGLGCDGRPGQPAARLVAFASPAVGLLSQALPENEIEIDLRLPAFTTLDALEVTLDGVPALDLAGGGLRIEGRRVLGTLGALPEGRHEIEAHGVLRLFGVIPLPLQASTWLERVVLDRPDQCEILNQIECALIGQ